MALGEYFKAQDENKAAITQFEPFAVLLPSIESLYNRAVELLPKDKPIILFGQFLLICHKSFLAATSLIAQAQPDDASPITRRVIEVVRLAAAVKENPKNLDEWGAYEKRMERWHARQGGKRPKPLNISLQVNHPLVNELMNTWGILSDATVHFTPEYFATLDWENRGKELFLKYFTGDERTLLREIVILAGTHTKILQILDWCVDSGFSSSAEWRSHMEKHIQLGKHYSQQFDHKASEEASSQATQKKESV